MSKGKPGGNLKGFYILFATIAVIGIGAVGYSVGSKALGTAAMEPVDLAGVGEDMRLLTEMAVPITEGEESAPVTIVVFGDYFCSHCAAFSLRERPRVLSEYVETGKARLVFYDFVLDPRPEAGTFLAARAARCAGDQGRYWEYHERLYRSQLTWGGVSDKLGVFLEYGEALGLDRDEFRACLNSDRHAEEVSANIQLAHALGLDGTPAILVGTEGGMSRRLPTYSFETIQEAVEAILGGSGLN
ncbi:MAG: DsbA family protein [Longimicrobiales bacterium]|nr:DsbA family protein [Longimicrobiales bacterium]